MSNLKLERVQTTEKMVRAQYGAASPARQRFAPIDRLDEQHTFQGHFSKGDAGGVELAGVLGLHRRLDEVGFGVEGHLGFPAGMMLAVPDGPAFPTAFYPALVEKTFFPKHEAFIDGSAGMVFPRQPLVLTLVEAVGPFALGKTAEHEAITYNSWFETLRTRPGFKPGEDLDLIGATQPLDLMRKLEQSNTLGVRPPVWATVRQQMRVLGLELKGVRGRIIYLAHAAYGLANDALYHFFNRGHFSSFVTKETNTGGEIMDGAPEVDAMREAGVFFGGDNACFLDSVFTEDIIRNVLRLGEKETIPKMMIFPLMDIVFEATMQYNDATHQWVPRPKEVQIRRLKNKAHDIAGVIGKKYAEWQFGEADVERLLRLTLYMDAYFYARNLAVAATKGMARVGRPNFVMSNPRYDDAPEIVVIVATPGAGKTMLAESLAEALKESGEVRGIIPVFKGAADDEWDEGPGVTGVSVEHTVRREQWRAMLNGGLFLAAEGYGDIGYGIRRSDLESAALSGGRWVVVCGPEAADNLKREIENLWAPYSLIGRADLGLMPIPTPKVSVVPFDAEEKVTTIRMEEREKTTGRKVVGAHGDRSEASKNVRKWTRRFWTELGFVETAAPIDLSEKFADVATKGEKGKIARAALAKKIWPQIATLLAQPSTPARRRGDFGATVIPDSTNPRRLLAESYLGDAVEALAAQDAVAAQKAMLHFVLEMFILQNPDGRGPLTIEEIGKIGEKGIGFLHEVAQHLLNTEATMQRAAAGTLLPAIVRPGHEDDITSNEIRRIVATLTPEERRLAALLHDVGKAGQSNREHAGRLVHPTETQLLHDRESAAILEKTGILSQCQVKPVKAKVGGQDVEGEEKARQETRMRRILLKAIENHHRIGYIFQGGNSILGFAEMLEDKELQALICEGDKIDKDAATALINRIFAITVADVGSKGILTRTAARNYLETRSRILDILCPAKGEATLTEARREILAEAMMSARERLACLAAPLDIQAESTVPLADLHLVSEGVWVAALGRNEMGQAMSVGHYLSVADAALQPDAAAGLRAVDGDVTREHLYQVGFPYADLYALSVPNSSATPVGQLSPIIIKVMAAASNVAKILAAATPSRLAVDGIMDVVFVDENYNMPRSLLSLIEVDATGEISRPPFFDPFVKRLRATLGRAQVSTTLAEDAAATRVGAAAAGESTVYKFKLEGEGESPDKPFDDIEVIIPAGLAARFDPQREIVPRQRVYVRLKGLNLDKEEGYDPKAESQAGK